MDQRAPSLILISGPVGVGKTSVAQEMSTLLVAQEIAHTFMDLDALTHTYPRPRDDTYGQTLALKNLQAVWSNAQASNPLLLVVARVIETKASARQIADAVAIDQFKIVQLSARDETLLERVRKREIGKDRAWHEARAIELARNLSETDFADLIIQTDDLKPTEIAAELSQKLGLV